MLHNMRQLKSKILEKDDKVNVCEYLGIFMHYFLYNTVKPNLHCQCTLYNVCKDVICRLEFYFFFKNI